MHCTLFWGSALLSHSPPKLCVIQFYVYSLMEAFCQHCESVPLCQAQSHCRCWLPVISQLTPFSVIQVVGRGQLKIPSSKNTHSRGSMSTRGGGLKHKQHIHTYIHRGKEREGKTQRVVVCVAKAKLSGSWSEAWNNRQLLQSITHDKPSVVLVNPTKGWEDSSESLNKIVDLPLVSTLPLTWVHSSCM